MRVGGDGTHDICLPHLAGCTLRVYPHDVIALALRDNSYTSPHLDRLAKIHHIQLHRVSITTFTVHILPFTLLLWKA